MKLIIEDDEGRKTVVPIVREDVEITIGRQEGNTIRLTERNVSRRHAKLTRRNGSVVVEDLGSYNGIKVNGDKIRGPFQIREGDLIQIGDYDLAVQYEDAARIAPAADDSTELTAPHGMVALRPASDAEPHKNEATAIISSEHLKATHDARRIEDIPVDAAPRLVLTTTELAPREYACIRTEVRIGRTDDNDIAIDHRSLSRNHCKLIRGDDGEWRVLDLQSANGVKVNGDTYAESALRFGDTIELGHVKLRFLAAGQSLAQAPELANRAAAAGDLDTTQDIRPPRRRSRSPWPLGAGVVVAVGLLGWFLTRPSPPKKPTTSPELAQARGPSTEEPRPPEPPAAAPDRLPGQGAVDSKAAELLEAGRALLEAGRFPEAEKKLGAAAELGATGAATLLERTRAEQEAQRRLAEARTRIASKDLAGARRELTAIPPTSGLAPKAAVLLAQVEAEETIVRERNDKKRVEEDRKRAADETRRKAEDERRRAAEQARLRADEDRRRKEEQRAAAIAQASLDKSDQAAQDAAGGRDLLKKKKYKEAALLIERALAADPALAELHMYLGICYASLGDAKKGALHYEQFVRLRPDAPQAATIREHLRVYYESGGEKP